MKTEEEIIDELKRIDEYIDYLNLNNFGIGVAIYNERKFALKWVLGKSVIEKTELLED